MKKIYIMISIVILFGCPSVNGTGNRDPRVWDETVPEFTQTGGGSTYYVKNGGDDNADGLSDSTAWATLDKVNAFMYSFQPGDTVLFNCGDIFRGHLEPMAGSEANWIKYGSYGTGDKPQIIGSIDLKDSSQWELHSGNIWKTVDDISDDVGGIFFNSVDSDGYYSDFGLREWSIVALSSDKDFYFDQTGIDKKLYLYSSGGNPGTLNSNIEASLDIHLVELNQREYVLFENLHLNKGAGHGFSGDRTQYIVIRNCDFSYMGGGFLYYDSDNSRNVRYGNGIEFWTDANNILVDANRFWEIFDTAVTNQGHSKTSTQRYIYYFNNIMWNCGLASFELWLRDSASEMGNIYFINNTSVNPGYGWGGSANREDKNSFHVASYYNSSSGDTLVIKNNIFYTSATPPGATYHLFFFDENVAGTGYGKYIIDNNIWYNPASPTWGITTSNLYTNFTDWKNINNQSQNGSILNPQFVDFANDDFSLQAGSPAIDAGELIFREIDFNGNPNAGNLNTPDIGAIERQ